jgi:hypothetical protein
VNNKLTTEPKESTEILDFVSKRFNDKKRLIPMGRFFKIYSPATTDPKQECIGLTLPADLNSPSVPSPFHGLYHLPTQLE